MPHFSPLSWVFLMVVFWLFYLGVNILLWWFVEPVYGFDS